jgi:hypothetical protein
MRARMSPEASGEKKRETEKEKKRETEKEKRRKCCVPRL